MNVQLDKIAQNARCSIPQDAPAVEKGSFCHNQVAKNANQAVENVLIRQDVNNVRMRIFFLR